jgi:hypothetical protein
MRNKKDKNFIKVIYLRSQNAEAIPPLGTVLGI